MSESNFSLQNNSFDDLEEDHVYRCKNSVLTKVEKAKNLRHSARRSIMRMCWHKDISLDKDEDGKEDVEYLRVPSNNITPLFC